MTAPLTEELANILGVSGEVAQSALDSLVDRIREEIKSKGEARLEGIGVFRGGAEGIAFEPASEIQLLANRPYEGFEPVIVNRPAAELDRANEPPAEVGESGAGEELAATVVPPVSAGTPEADAPVPEEEQWEVGRAIEDLFSLDMSPEAEGPRESDALESMSATVGVHTEETSDSVADEEETARPEEAAFKEESPDEPSVQDTSDAIPLESEPVAGTTPVDAESDVERATDDVLAAEEGSAVRYEPELEEEKAAVPEPKNKEEPTESLDGLAKDEEQSRFAASPPVRHRRRRRRRTSRSSSKSGVRRQKRFYVAGMSALTLVVIVAVLWFLWSRFGPQTTPPGPPESTVTQSEYELTPSQGVLPAAADDSVAARDSTVVRPTAAESQTATTSDDRDGSASELPTEIETQPETEPDAARPATTEQPAVTEQAEPLPYSWVIASVPDQRGADARIERLRASGYDAEAIRATVNGMIRYRIAIGRYQSADDALRSRSDLPPGSDDAWVARVR